MEGGVLLQQDGHRADELALPHDDQVVVALVVHDPQQILEDVLDGVVVLVVVLGLALHDLLELHHQLQYSRLVGTIDVLGLFVVLHRHLTQVVELCLQLFVLLLVLGDLLGLVLLGRLLLVFLRLIQHI